MVKNKTNRIKILGTIIMLMLVLAFVPHITTEAASAKTKAFKAYQKFLKTNAKVIDRFGTAYINNDNIPELIFEQDYSTYIYTYKNGKLKQWFEEEYIKESCEISVIKM